MDPETQLEVQRQLQDERRAQIQSRYYAKLVQLVQTESQVSQANRQRVHEIWRERLRTGKRTELTSKVEELIQDFDHHVDRKDALVALLGRYISIAEEQRRRAVRTHLSTLDGLFQQLQERASVFEEGLEDELARLQAQYEQERDALKSAYDAREHVLTEILESTREQEAALLQELQADYGSKLTEMRNQSTETCNILRLHLEEANSDLERHLLEAHERYKSQTEAKQHQFKILLLKDEQSSIAIREQEARIKRLTRQIAHWRNKIAATADEFTAKNALLRKEKESAYQEFSQLKERLSAFRESERQRMKSLVSSAHDAEARIISQREQADKIIRLATLCSRMETEAERIGEVERLDEETKASIDEACRKQQEQTVAAYAKENDFVGKGAILAVQDLTPVYRRLSRATIDRLALEREAVLLRKENAEFRDTLQRFLSTSGVAAAPK